MTFDTRFTDGMLHQLLNVLSNICCINDCTIHLKLTFSIGKYNETIKVLIVCVCVLGKKKNIRDKFGAINSRIKKISLSIHEVYMC